MRRVIDDSMYTTAKNAIMNAVQTCELQKIQKYCHGMMRTNVGLIKTEVLNIINHDETNYAFGKTSHKHGIGNNNAIEIIWLGDPKEQQICGLFHVTDDMFGRCICWVSDFDEVRRTKSIKR